MVRSIPPLKATADRVRLHHRVAAWLILLSVLVVLPSCASKGVNVSAPVAVPDAFSECGTAEVPDQWWRTFGDEGLNAAVDQALADNLDLRAAWDRLEQTWALARQSGTALWPSVTVSAEVSRTMTQAAGGDITQYGLGLAASYEVDLWGRVRAGRDAARLDVLAGNEDLHSAAMTLSAEVAGVWYSLVTQHGILRLLDEQIQTNEQYLEVITLRFRRGQASASDVLQQRQLLESTRGDRVQAESTLRILEHQLAVLVGRAPGSLGMSVPQLLPALPPLPQTGLPAEWLSKRPDVRAAYLRVQAADRRVAEAIADQFPQLGLSVRAETSAERVRDLFDNWLANLAANVVAPLFDAGLRRAEVARTRAVTSERINAYGQAILTGLQEVEDALTQEAKQQQYLKSLRAQLDLSRKSTDQIRDNYAKGVMDFTRYLTTLLSHQRLQRQHLQAQQDLIQFRINLYRALGGGWALPVPPRAVADGPQTPVGYPGGLGTEWVRAREAKKVNDDGGQ